jgi:hypothetical protein
MNTSSEESSIGFRTRRNLKIRNDPIFTDVRVPESDIIGDVRDTENTVT